MDNNEQVKVLFVCMGNICRSPTAHGIFDNLIDQQNSASWLFADSAGTHGYHVGGPPDPRSSATARANNIDISRQTSRQVTPADFNNFDYILAMDNSNFSNLQAIQIADGKAKLHRMMEFSNSYQETEVPDPYYGDDGFDLVFEMLSDACNGLYGHIKSQR